MRTFYLSVSPDWRVTLLLLGQEKGNRKEATLCRVASQSPALRAKPGGNQNSP
jgi:hypothetical protein